MMAIEHVTSRSLQPNFPPRMADSPRKYTSLDDYEADLSQFRGLAGVKSAELSLLAGERAAALRQSLWAAHVAERAAQLAGDFRGIAEAAWSDADDYARWQAGMRAAERA